VGDLPRARGKQGSYRLFFWIVLGSCVLLLPLLFIMAKNSVDQQTRFTTELLKEKGEALIRSYEAGTRALAAHRLRPFEIQKLVTELAMQPGVDYIILTNDKGLVVADSEPFRIGGYYGIDLNLKNLSEQPKPIFRRVKNIKGADTFEVFRRVKVLGEGEGNYVIFVGLDMGPVIEAENEEIRRTVALSAVLLLAGMVGLIALFFIDRYRLTRSSLERLRLFSHYLLEHLPIGVVSINERGKITLVNAYASNLLGLSEAHVLDLSMDGVLPPALKNILTQMRQRPAIDGAEIEWISSEGKTVSIETIAQTLEDKSLVVILRDLTEVKYLRQELERSRRLAAIGSLAAGVAHEIRNPLSSIKGFATYFLEKYGVDPSARESAGIMISEIERLNGFITQLLNLARPPDLRREMVDLHHLVEDSIKVLAEDFAKKGVRVTNEVPHLTSFCDPNQMKQVFLNVLLNALEATEGGGFVSVTGEEIAENRIEIKVIDTGHGIKDEDLTRIFDPFFTTKPSGTGLGLAVVHKIMEAHEGEVRVTSTPGKGTCVILILLKEDRGPI